MWLASVSRRLREDHGISACADSFCEHIRTVDETSHNCLHHVHHGRAFRRVQVNLEHTRKAGTMRSMRAARVVNASALEMISNFFCKRRVYTCAMSTSVTKIVNMSRLTMKRNYGNFRVR